MPLPDLQLRRFFSIGQFYYRTLSWTSTMPYIRDDTLCLSHRSTTLLVVVTTLSSFSSSGITNISTSGQTGLECGPSSSPTRCLCAPTLCKVDTDSLVRQHLQTPFLQYTKNFIDHSLRANLDKELMFKKCQKLKIVEDLLLKPSLKSLHLLNPLSWGESLIYSVAKLVFSLTNSELNLLRRVY